MQILINKGIINEKKLTVIFLLLLSICTSISAQRKVRVACIGLAEHGKNAYPAQLQNMLGNEYQLINFVHSAPNVPNDKGYSKTKRDAMASRPDIVIINLDVNHIKPPTGSSYGEFEAKYRALISDFKQLPIKPRILLLSPLPAFRVDSNHISNKILLANIIPIVQQVAFDEKLEIINLYPLFIDKPELFPDKIHLSSSGTALVASRLYEALKQKENKDFDFFSEIREEKKISNFYGFECTDFTFNGRNCKVVKPKKATKGNPWIWRARFWGHEPQTDVSLLERGFHVVYCDVAELFGNAEAIELWNKFYKRMHQSGLSEKVALEGMSRGGVYVYNWALANPGKVACIYADAPVLDLRSWPGGKRNDGAEQAWAEFKQDYKLTEEQALAFSNSPLNNAEKIAKLGFPMLHVVGDADNVVPVAENTGPFEQRILAAGGNIKVIHKPGVNHHPHSLQDPTPITNFILGAMVIK